MRRNTRGGFTLIELFLALAIFATVATALAGTFHSGIQTWRRVEARSRQIQPVRVAFEMMAQDLRNALSFPEESFKGTRDSITFHTVRSERRSLEGSVPQILKVTYQLAPSRKISKAPAILQRIEVRYNASLEERVETAREITSQLTDLEFQFAYTPPEESNEPQWESEWQESEVFPMGIRLEMTLHPNDDEKQKETYSKTFFIPKGIWKIWKT